jgi:hypothetical protein
MTGTATKKKASAKKTTAPKKATSTQKLAALEDKAMAHERNFLVLADEIDQLKVLIQGLNKRLNAAIKAGETEDGLSNQSVQDIIIEENEKELKGKVDFLVEQGLLKKLGKKEVADIKSFIVGKEVDSESGKVVNPRAQFSVGSLSPDLQEKVIGLKLGDSTSFREEDPDFVVTELYSIVDPEINKEFEEETGTATPKAE